MVKINLGMIIKAMLCRFLIFPHEKTLKRRSHRIGGELSADFGCISRMAGSIFILVHDPGLELLGERLK